MGVIYSNGIYYSGPPGRGVQSITLNDNATLTFLFTDGTSWTSDSVRGPRGNGITSITATEEGTLVFTLEDGTSYESEPINALPDVSENDAGKILQVDNSGDWHVTEFDPLPEFDEGDVGKSLYVGTDRSISAGFSETDVWVKYTDSDEQAVPVETRILFVPLPDVDASDYGSFLMVGEDGKWTTAALSDGNGVQF